MGTGTLYGALATRNEIAAVSTPPPQGPRHKPVPHTEVVDCTKQVLADMGFGVNRERFNLSGKNVGIDGKMYHNTTLYGILNIYDTDPEVVADKEMTTILGLCSNNMCKKSIRYIAGGNMTICDNGIWTADHIVGSKMHTLRLNLMESLNVMFDAWLNSKSALDQQIEVMRNSTITEEQAKAILFDLFNNNVLPLKNLRETAHTFFCPEDEWTDVVDNRGTLWGVHNAVTRVLRPMPIEKQMMYSGATTSALVAIAA